MSIAPLTGPQAPSQPLWFLILFAFAAAGGAVAYVPLLTVLLPQFVAELAGGEDVAGLAQVTFLGAATASLANIAFGMLSDRTGNRRGWIFAGLVSSNLLLLAIGEANSLATLIVLLMAWQVGLNLMLAPLMAWAGDCFPDSQKGRLGGALALAPALGALAGSLVTYSDLVPPAQRLAWVAALVSMLVLPALGFGRGRARAQLLSSQTDGDAAPARRHPGLAVRRMWLARFFIQVAEGGMFAFLLFWLRDLAPGFSENTAANIFSVVLVAAVPASMVVGRWSDRSGRPIQPLAACALLCAIGMSIMAAASTLTAAISGYVLFAIAAAVFLSLHASQTLRVLPSPMHRGRDLGLFNLTNTLPAMVMPWLTVLLVPTFGFAALFAAFAALSLASAILLASFARPARRSGRLWRGP